MFASLNTQGDWICSACANEIGFNVDIKGYEYAPDDSAITIDDKSSDGLNPVDLTDTPDKPAKKKSRDKTDALHIDLDDSDAPIDDVAQLSDHSDEGESPVGRRKKNKAQTKKIIDLDDSDDE